MSDSVTLTVRSPGTGPVEADCVRPDRFAALGEREIAALPVWQGRREVRLGDVFDVRGARAARVQVVGDVRHVDGIASGMTAGELVIEGDAGARVAAALAGGRVDVRGSVGDDAGLGMRGGSLRIRGGAGHRVGAAAPGASRGMTGGEIIVEGSVGTEAGARMRRGLLFVGGQASERTARAMIAGTVVVLGRTGPDAAFASKRGTLVAAGGVDVPATYRYACSYEPPHVRLALTYLQRRHGVAIAQDIIAGRYRRYCGDAGTLGRGEILEWVSS